MSKEPRRNVYVGHRYVPLIVGEWNKTETYEGLSIVTHQGTSFTSKKRVPRGIDILNTEYWVVTGNYNEQIENYRKDVRELENKVRNDLKDTLNLVDNSLNDINNKIENNNLKTKTILPLSFFNVDTSGNNFSDEGFKEALNFAVENNISEIIGEKNAIYKIKDTINIPSNIRLDLKGSLVESFIDEENKATFEMKGKKSNNKYYLNDDVIEGQDFLLVDHEEFKPNDFIIISQNHSSSDDPKMRYTEQLLKIEEVINNRIILSEPITHNYNILNNVNIRKVNVIENSEVVNIIFDHKGSTKRVHSVMMENTDSCNVENIRSFNGGGKGVQVTLSREFNIHNIRVKDRTNLEAGHGYAIQIHSSSFGNVSNIFGYKTRHTVDLAEGSHHVNVSNAFAFNNSTSSFHTHGQNCKFISFVSCHSVGAVYGFAFGNSSFIHDEFISVINSTATSASNSSFYSGNGSKKILFVNCTAKNSQNGFILNDSFDSSVISCLVENVSNKGFGSRDSEQTKFIGNSLSGVNGVGLSIENSLNSIIESVSFTGRILGEIGIEIVNSNDVLISDILLDINLDIGSAFRIRGKSHDIKINGLDIKGNAKRYGIEVTQESHNISLSNLNINIFTDLDVIRLGTTTNDLVDNIKISHSNIKTNNLDNSIYALRSHGTNLLFTQNDVEGNLIFLNEKILMVINNLINGTIDVRTTKAVNYSGNLGNINVENLLEHDGINIIRKDNIENIT